MTEKMEPFVRDQSGNYVAMRPIQPEEIICLAKRLTACKLQRDSAALKSPDHVRDYLSVHLGAESIEIFWGVFLDNRHRVIEHSVLATGSIDTVTVHPREVVKKALACNAAAVIFAHNHPSGVTEPSDTDIRLTRRLTEVLNIINIRVVDHLIIGGQNITSLKERGLIQDVFLD